mmetsp:Transcript_14866/g.32422  ORF Transcript_14866/g.32422 Transcript_14866/m.32422 type:complete len:148 (-) Transcript_14866:147-590(-)
MDDAAEALMEAPPCTNLVDASCACTKRCASRSSSDNCSKAMIARLECSLAIDQGCGGHTCPKSSFAWNGKMMGVAKDVAARLCTTGVTGEEKEATSASGGLVEMKDDMSRLHNAEIREEKDAARESFASTDRGLAARAAGASARAGA